MNIEEIRNYCLAKKGATESFPFDKDVLVFKVLKKMFAFTSLKKWEEGERSFNLKCDPEYAILLRQKYSNDIFPGYHMHKKHWNTVVAEGGNLSEKLLKELIDHSYDMVVKTLTKKDRDILMTST